MLVLHLPRASVLARTSIRSLLRRRLGRAPADQLVHAFALCPDEQAFAATVSRRKPELWLFRSHQRAFCGDFAVVDMSAPQPEQRPVWLIDLKQRGRLRTRGAPGQQLLRAPAAVDELRRRGVIGEDVGYQPLSGDRRLVQLQLGIRCCALRADPGRRRRIARPCRSCRARVRG